ncbi:PssE/Cps14G family polysaccharide biosynthesis glycosyltransferase [Vibrio parahaemolyticus]|uniref:PssE/Cps14G family polysaccharide biosynthesis glycosyltransferase n=1 Tax=Vibrio parahaemolyticus TaxID=670 RepID=UPI001123ACF7|nr:PssE/Cps14G family polysaccharide biosynthesis glycosyltransferase [Vibrio parahaemolyticus]MCX8788731.1 glycosyltransferase [Vibrio parahaemolyticus]MCX8849854.1 glycosyltransferase [Vibrio parahaemolyticus]TOP31052.1 glycosyltransferase [Vibrio parahaemolyticus]
MKIFVTVGTTKFDTLIRAVDFSSDTESHQYTYQIADGEYKPSSGSYFTFTSDIEDYYNQADVVITHAGAGSIYGLLERNKTIIIVPNLDRVDKHQSDIADFMEEGGYARVCYNMELIGEIISSIVEFQPRKFIKKDFFKQEEISRFILGV